MSIHDFIQDFQRDRIIIITGAPGCGKTTYARQHRERGDIVVDLDYIASALMLSTSAHDSRDEVLDTAWYIREMLIDAIINNKITYSKAFIIATRDAKKLQQRTGGTVVNLDVGLEETLRRIDSDTETTEEEKRHRKDLAFGYYYKGDDKR